MARLDSGHRLAEAINEYLSDMEAREKSPHTIRAYRGDLYEFAAGFDGDLADIDSQALRTWRLGLTVGPSTKARKQAAVRSWLAWCVRADYLAADPGSALDSVTVTESLPRPAPPGAIPAILAVIPRPNLRDRALFGLIAATGARAAEAAGVYIEDIHIDGSHRHINLLGKGRRRRIVHLDDERYVALLRRHLGKLAKARSTTGPAFRAGKNYVGGGLRYSTVQELWSTYRKAAGWPGVELHQLRHSRATALANDGITAQTIRSQLGHADLRTSQRYIDLAEAAAATELRGRRR